jgi:phytoene synthase
MTEGSTVDVFDHCEQLVRAGDKDRFLATLFAPQKYRRALFVLYAFNLEVARTRELAREPMPGELRLQFWRDALVGRGEAHPVATALRDVVVRYQLPSQMLLDLIDARELDLYNEPMAQLTDLERYASRTSSALMALAARTLMDGREPDIGPLTDHAGMAYAIAGMLRALPVHAARGQIYLPVELLERYGVPPASVVGGEDTTRLRAVLAEVRLRARQHLAEARPALAAAPAAVLPAVLPLALVRPVLGRMERRSYRPFRPQVMPQWRRQWALWRAARTALRSAF